MGKILTEADLRSHPPAPGARRYQVEEGTFVTESARSWLDNLKGVAMASDAFFPFRDDVDELAARGVTAIIQPGGSVRDEEVIAACDEHNIAMVFTGRRHFRH